MQRFARVNPVELDMIRARSMTGLTPDAERDLVVRARAGEVAAK